jgi:Ca2+/Na+ antiporter
MNDEPDENLIDGQLNVRVANIRRHYAKFRFNLINLKHRLQYRWFANRGKTEFFIWLIAFTVLVLASKLAHSSLQLYLRDDKFVDTLRATALQLGSSLLGATAIVASLVLFAMQVNVERLTHGLFRRLSTDKRLLASFAVSFVASILVVSLPLITPIEWAEWAIIAAILLTLVVLRLFLAAYRRSLSLINPVEQLRIIIGDVTVALNTWSKQADWSTAALPPRIPDRPPNPVIDSTVNTRRAAFMLHNGWGGVEVRRGLDHCISVNGRAASQGDYLVAERALTTLVSINAAYIQAKGKTFFAENGFIHQPLATDPVINYSLEQLKRQFRFAVGRRDEEHVNMLLNAYGALAALYAQIDYGRPEADPWHAKLAIGYLESDIRSTFPQNLPDSIMEGVRVLGRCAIVLLNRGEATEIVSIVNELGPIGAAMILREDHRPVAVTAMEQLAEMTYHMINTGVWEPGYAFEEIASSVKMIATVAMNQPNNGFKSVPSYVLGPYFSYQDTSLSSRFKQLTNALLNCPFEDEKAKICVANLHEWAKRTQPIAKDILILAVEKRSKFTLDILRWVGDIVEVLLAVASAPVANEYFGSELKKLAERWALALSWIPDDAESIDCASTWSATSMMFEIARAARKWHSDEVYEAAQRNLLRWALRPGRRANAWHDVDEAMLAAVAIALKSPDDPDGAAFVARLKKALQAEHLPPAELLNGAAQGLMRCIDDYDKDHLRRKGWDHILKAFDPEKRRQLLTDVANLLQEAAQGR